MAFWIISIGVLLTALEVVASAGYAFYFEDTMPPLLSGVVACLLAVFTVVFWTFYTMAHWRDRPAVQRRMLLSCELSIPLFLVVEAYLVLRCGTVNPFFR